jgi:hypothetical protein
LKNKVVDGYKGLKEKLFRKKNRKKDKRWSQTNWV